MANTVVQPKLWHCVAAILAIPGAAVHAADWKFTPTLDVTERFTDNVMLTADPNTESSFVTEISPGLKWNFKGAHVKADADYRLSGYLYSYDGSQNKLANDLTANLRSKFWDDRLTLDGEALIAQRPSSRLGAIGEGGYNTSGNLTETRSLSLTPGLKTRFGDVAKAEARLALTYVNTDNGLLQDTRGSDLHLALSSGTAFHLLSWGLTYRQRTSDSSISNFESRTTTANLGYMVSPKAQIGVNLGYDDNEGSDGVQRLSGSSWSTYLAWNPGPRTTVTANFGNRFNSSSYGLNVLHRMRRTTWSLRYDESIADVYQQVTQRGVVLTNYVCADGRVLPVSQGVPSDCVLLGGLGSYQEVAQIVDETYLNKAWSGSVSYKLRRNQLTLGFSSSQRDLLTSGTSDEFRTLTGNWVYDIGSRTQSTLSASISTTDQKTLGPTGDYWTIGWLLNRRFTPSASGGLEVRRIEHSGSQANSDYSENSVAARLNMTF